MHKTGYFRKPGILQRTVKLATGEPGSPVRGQHSTKPGISDFVNGRIAQNRVFPKGQFSSATTRNRVFQNMKYPVIRNMHKTGYFRKCNFRALQHITGYFRIENMKYPVTRNRVIQVAQWWFSRVFQVAQCVWSTCAQNRVYRRGARDCERLWLPLTGTCL